MIKNQVGSRAKLSNYHFFNLSKIRYYTNFASGKCVQVAGASRSYLYFFVLMKFIKALSHLRISIKNKAGEMVMAALEMVS